MENYKYVGCFIEHTLLADAVRHCRTNPLKHEKAFPHITFHYRPQTVDKTLFGTKIIVTIIGYGFDEQNEGLLVTLNSDNEKINDMIQQIPVPHITLSISDDGQAVNTRYLSFEKTDPIEIIGSYGGFEEGEQKVCII